MSTAGVIIGTLKRHRDHYHLEWVCRDCGTFNFVGSVTIHRFVCERSGREFLVIGLPTIVRAPRKRWASQPNRTDAGLGD
jgi:hypothetical protein